MDAPVSKAGRSLSFGTKLALGFAGVALAAVAAVTLPMLNKAHNKAAQDLRDKAVLYARLIGPQLRPVVAFDDELTAREVFAPFAADKDVAGLAVYTADGQVIASYGQFPARIVAGQTAAAPGPGRKLVVSPVKSPEGPEGTLAVVLSTTAVDAELRDQTITALLCAGGALVLAAIIAALFSRPVAGRLGRIAAATAKVAAGDLEQPDVPAGANDEIGRLVRSFNTMVEKVRQQFAERKQLADTEQARLEAIVSTRTSQLEESRDQYRLIAESTNAIPFTYLPRQGVFAYIGPQVEKCLGFPTSRWLEPGFLRAAVVPTDVDMVSAKLADAGASSEFEFEAGAMSASSVVRQLRWVVTTGEMKGERCLRGLMLDITHQRKLESDLQQAQKLESVGRLASGVAHEINTPVQFVGDNLGFLRDATIDLLGVVEKLRIVSQSVVDGAPAEETATLALQAHGKADVPYLTVEMPKAFHSAQDGLSRVAAIVRSMKEFARPDSREMSAVDLNKAIQSTLVIAANEYKYVAVVTTEFGELPDVLCYAGEINQVVLNIIVNAAHAIGDVVKESDGMGNISVRTYREDEFAVIAIGDSGRGIPEHIRGRIFDPFFTTKEVGKGTGQGLTIARSVVVDKHGGDLQVQSQVGVGSTFIIKLPINGAQVQHAAA